MSTHPSDVRPVQPCSPPRRTRGAGSPGRPDRRALGSPRGGDGPPAGADPRVRRPRRLGNGFRSCAEWLAWRVGLDPGAARERVRVARALEDAAGPGRGTGARGALLCQGARADPHRDPGDRSRGCSQWGAPARRRTSRASSGAGADWIGRPTRVRPHASTRAGRCTSIRRRTAPWSCTGALTPEVGALLLRALDAARETLYQRRRATEASLPATDAATGDVELAAAAGRRPGAAGRDGAASRARSGSPRGARSGRGAPGAERRAGTQSPCAHGARSVVRGTAGRALGDRRAASAGCARTSRPL